MFTYSSPSITSPAGFSPVRLVLSRAELPITTHTPNIQLYSANIKHDYISPNNDDAHKDHSDDDDDGDKGVIITVKIHIIAQQHVFLGVSDEERMGIRPGLCKAVLFFSLGEPLAESSG
ncbi:hypothetical protein PoB_001814300 [Plakobranchus ocellatus]|uniref:Uncharacterized protein n=1 Tax=Plakobranchus ocellatus TaxID=259542 RepID=A0AAV3ZA43_9GAST|nr:hypothetical protein PoB_001814300 [Plakobranchus ocellatus]